MGLNITWYNLDINFHKKIKRVQYWVYQKALSLSLSKKKFYQKDIYFFLRFNIFYLPYESYDIKKIFEN